MKNELTSFEGYSVLELVKRPKNTKIVKSKWVLTIKNDKESDDSEYKADRCSGV